MGLHLSRRHRRQSYIMVFISCSHLTRGILKRIKRGKFIAWKSRPTQWKEQRASLVLQDKTKISHRSPPQEIHRMKAIRHGLTSEEKDRGNHADTETETSVHKEIGNLLFTMNP